MPALSLVALSTKACIKNIRSLQDVGDFEYFQIHKVLARVSDPDQLRRIEENSPQIKGEDAELWKRFIARDIPDWKKKNYVPKNPMKWYEVYKKYKREQEREIEEDKQRLKEAMLGLQKEKENHVSQKVDPKSLPKLPRDPRMMPNDGGVPTGGRRKGFVKVAPNSLSWSAGSKTKTNTAAGVLNRARREAKELSARNRLVKPTHQLQRQQISQAPKGMINEHRRASQPSLRIYTPKRRVGAAGQDHSKVSGPSLEERERRLRALTVPKRDEPGFGRVTVVDSDSDDDASKDLFGESYMHQSISPLPKRAPSQARETRPSHSSSLEKLPALPNPSEVIRSLISKPKPKPQAKLYASPPSQRLCSPSKSMASIAQPGTENSMRTGSPQPGKPRPMMPKRRAPVDIFNRGGAAAKKTKRQV